MTIRLLKQSETPSKADALDRRILYHLSLDRSFGVICPPRAAREVFLSVLLRLTDDVEEIRYRQGVLEEFMKFPHLEERLLSLFLRFEEMRISQKEAKKDLLSLNASGRATLDSIRNILQTKALSLKRTLLFVKGFGELLAEYPLKSEGLLRLREGCDEIFRSPRCEEMLSHCSRYENFSTAGFLDFRYQLNDEGRIEAYGFVPHRYIHVADPDLKKKGFALFKKERSPTEEVPCERVYPMENDFYGKMAVSALSELSSLFADTEKQIVDRFSMVYDDLLFYDAALRYVRKLEEVGVPYCFPTLNRENRTKVSGLYDLYLLTASNRGETIVPNDFAPCDKGGTVVFGVGGSGKTVYLRSVATMQLLAQAGLPIPCDYGEVGVYTQIATQFSEAEKEFCEGNEAGRFEQEVRELAKMVDTLRDGAMVFLNETFQSTSYAEGAEGLYDILMHFSERNIRWVLVSHLRQLEDAFDSHKAEVLHSMEGFRIG